MNDYEQKLEAKRERLEKAAEHAREEASRRFDAAHAATDGIPFGQPILVDHYSAKRHRAAIRRSDNAMRAGVEASKRADELARRAESVGMGEISSDDPEAIAKLEDKRTELEIKRDHMKAANAYYRAHGTLEGSSVPPEMIQDGMRTMQLCPYEKVPFPSYSLTNIGARIRDAAKRAERIEQVQAIPASSVDVGAATVSADPEENRVLLRFPARLSIDHYKMVRSGGFVWSPTRKAFVRKLSQGALQSAKQLAEKIAAESAQ